MLLLLLFTVGTDSVSHLLHKIWLQSILNNLDDGVELFRGDVRCHSESVEFGERVRW